MPTNEDLLQERVEELSTEVERLEKFKKYVHQRLDAMNIPVDPPSPHKEHGCRIGGRLDIVEDKLNKCKRRILLELVAKEWAENREDVGEAMKNPKARYWDAKLFSTVQEYFTPCP